MQLIQHFSVVLCHGGGEGGIEFRLNMIEKTHKSRPKYSNKVCGNLPMQHSYSQFRWYKSHAEQDLGLMGDKMLYCSEEGISAVF